MVQTAWNVAYTEITMLCQMIFECFFFLLNVGSTTWCPPSSQLPINPLQRIGLPWSNAGRLCSSLLPWHLTESFPILLLPPLLFFSISFLVFLFHVTFWVFFKYNQQDAMLYNIRYMFQAVSLPIIRSSKIVHTASSISRACLLLLLAVAVSKLDLYPMLCV